MIASIILALYLFGGMPLEATIPLLYISGVLLILSETILGTFGLAAVNGVLSLYVAYSLQTGDQTLFGFPFNWEILFGIAVFEGLLVTGMAFILKKLRKTPVSTGTESMLGHEASVVEWSGKKGRVQIQGEIWKAKSENAQALSEGDSVKIKSVKDLTAIIEPEP